ncbi:TMEM169 (predicted) [Pycnogonum litorale]
MSLERPPAFQPPRKRQTDGSSSRHHDSSHKKKTKVRSKFGESSRGVDVVVIPDIEMDSLKRDKSPSVTPTSTSRSLEKQPKCESVADDANRVEVISVISGNSNENCLTMTGTIRRGRKSVESIDVKLNLSKEELDKIEATIVAKNSPEDDDCFFGIRKGIHVFLLSLVCLPFVLILTLFYSFYFGTMTWYNVLLYYNEERTVLHKVFVSPLLILLFPFYIICVTLCLGIYAATVQLSWYYDNWKMEILDVEKGFYGWLCLQFGLTTCAPYEVVILEKNDVSECPTSANPVKSKSSDNFSDTAL